MVAVHAGQVLAVPWVGKQRLHDVPRRGQVVQRLKQRHDAQGRRGPAALRRGRLALAQHEHAGLALQQLHRQHVGGAGGHGDDVGAEALRAQASGHPARRWGAGGGRGSAEQE